MKISEKQKNNIYLFSIFLLITGLFFSKFLISLSQFIILFLWILEGNYVKKIKKLKQDKPALIFLSIYIFFLLGLIWTKDFNYAFHDLKIKLPLFAIPFLLLSSLNFGKKDIEAILVAFIIISFAKITQSSLVLLKYNFSPDVEELSCGISHIRYSLMLILAIFSIIHFLEKNKTKIFGRICSFLLIFIFIFFIIILQSITAIITLSVLLTIYCVILIKRTKNYYIKTLATLIIILLPTIGFLLFYSELKLFIRPKDTEIGLDKYTANGNKYTHDFNNIYLENGYHVGYYQCEKELKKEWNKRSKIKYDSTDKRGYKIKYTLERYLTSKGLRKDSEGIWSLSPIDIKNIEEGIANYRYSDHLSIKNRIYKIIWQFYVYKKTKIANNQSITQRIEFLRTGINILKKNYILGVGTGDVEKAFEKEYIDEGSKLLPKFRFRTHNEYLTILITLGIFLGTLVIISIYLPFFMNKKFEELLPTAFFIIVILSMFTDDIFETAVSVNFVSIFYTLLILNKNKEQ